MTADSSWPGEDSRRDTILDLIATETTVPRQSLRPDATIHELGIASIDLVQAVFAIEGRFGIEIPIVMEHEEAEFATVGGLVARTLAAIDAAD